MEKPQPFVQPDMIFSVSDASALLKNVVETAFPRLRVRGELSQITRATSGHMYMTIKDAGAAISVIIWRGTPVPFKLEDGMEVIITGRFTTYPARSNYQIIVSEIEMAGVGAILKMLEERKRKLAAEGLFDTARKKTLPRFPQRIGIVTSPTGAAFQDILAADARIKQVWSNFFPTISWQTSYTRLRQLQLSDALGQSLEFNYYLLGQVSLQQMLYDFGVTQNQATIRKLDYEGYKKTFEAIVNDVIYQTKDAYYNVLYAYENKRVALDTVEKYQLFYNQAKAFYETGENPKVDVTIAETNLSNAKLKLIQADNAVNLAIAKLNNIMGVPFIEKYDITDRLQYKPVNLTFEQAIDTARESRPELKLAEIKVEGSHQTVNLTKKSFLPSLTFEGQYQRGGKSWNSNYGFNIGGYLTFPAINAMLIRNEIKEAKYLYDEKISTIEYLNSCIGA